MRNKIRIIVCLMLVLCIAVFAVACQEKDADGLIKLSTPKNLALNGSVLSWDEVPNAKEYFISIKGEDEEEREQSVADNTTCDLSSIVTGYGNFEIKVRAYGDGQKYGTSDKSLAITYRKGDALDKPNLTWKEDKVAEWNAINGAVNYTVKVTNRAGTTLDEFTTEERSYSFIKENIYDNYDEYILSVIANPASDDIKHSPSLAGKISYYNSTVLQTPEFTSISGSYIYWNSVAYAQGYTLRLTHEDGTYQEKEQSSTATNYYFKSFSFEKAGKYTFTISAKGDEVYKTSEFSANNDKYVINQLAQIEIENINLSYADGSAKLYWKVPADSLAKEFIINLSAILPNGKTGWSSVNELKKTISNNIKPIEASTYDFYKYGEGGENGIVKQDGTAILVFCDEGGNAKVEYNGVEYYVKVKGDEDSNLEWEKYYHNSQRVDIIFDDSKNVFVYEEKQYHVDSAFVDQDTKQDAVSMKENNGRQRYYWGKVTGESDIAVARGFEYDPSDNTKITYHTFEIALDDIFIKKTVEDGGTKYEYLINNNNDKYYGIFYNVSLSAGNSASNNCLASQSVTLDSQYMSYKIPEYKDGKYTVTNAGEYAYIILNAFKNPSNTNEFSIEANINFNGYEVAQIDNFKGIINGNNHTVSGIAVGNKILTEDGVVENNNQATLQYTMFVNIDSNAKIQNVFYVGMSFVGYDVEKLDKDVVMAIQVAPIAIDNNGTISDVLVQTDSINAQSADVAGMIINNYGEINTAYVYATLAGRNVGGVMIDNKLNARVSNVGFYGKVTAIVGKILDEATTLAKIGGAGFAVDNSGIIENSFSIGNIDDKDKSFVIVTAEQLDGIYAGGFVAINKGNISNSYSGEFTLNNMIATVTANGNNAYAGGFVGYNEGTIASSYSTNEGAASVAGGFVGYNEASIENCYSTGGAKDADKNSENKGAFVGKNQGNYIVDCVSYSRDGKDKTVEGVTSTDNLDNVVATLYGNGEAVMGMMKDKGYRNPIIKGLIYSKDNTLSVIPGQTGENLKDNVLSRVAVIGDGENSVEVAVILHGDNRTIGNKIVIELKSEGFASRYVYGVIK